MSVGSPGTGTSVHLIGEMSRLQADIQVEAVTYRGLYHEYRLRLADGQAVAAVTTEPQPLREGDAAEIGVAAEDLVPLEDD